MNTLKFVGAVLALTLSTAAFAATADCCKGMECCKEKDGKKSCCCDEKKKDGDHADHDMSGTPK